MEAMRTSMRELAEAMKENAKRRHRSEDTQSHVNNLESLEVFMPVLLITEASVDAEKRDIKSPLVNEQKSQLTQLKR